MKPPYRVMSMDEINELPKNGFKVVSTFSGCGGSSLGYRMAGFDILWANEFIDEARKCYIKNKSSHTIVDGRDIRDVKAQDILEAIGLKPGDLDLFDGSPPCSSFSTAGKRESGWGSVKKYSDKAQRTDDLFFEYTRLLKELQPKTFVAENVSGLIKGTAKGYFLQILKELKDCGYKVSAKVLDAQHLGVPQARQRLIFVGVRNDILKKPIHPLPLPYIYSVKDAIPYILNVKHGGSAFNYKTSSLPSPTIMSSDALRNESAYLSGGGFVEAETDISKYAIGDEWNNLKIGETSSKYFNLSKVNTNKPCPTVCASHGLSSIASIVHPTEKRKFSIAELKRICGFPDDFILTGTFAQKWERLGRAVPPVMMMHIAATVRDKILCE